MKRDELPTATADILRAAFALAHPCDCGRPHCVTSGHLWQIGLDHLPGPRATNYDPRNNGTHNGGPELPDRPDPNAGLLERYKNLLIVAQASARNLTAFIEANRPDRHVPIPEPDTDRWCRPHLDAGHCEERYRGDLCRWCWGLAKSHNSTPDSILIRARERGRINDRDIADWIARTRTTRRPKRRRAG